MKTGVLSAADVVEVRPPALSAATKAELCVLDSGNIRAAVAEASEDDVAVTLSASNTASPRRERRPELAVETETMVMLDAGFPRMFVMTPMKAVCRVALNVAAV